MEVAIAAVGRLKAGPEGELCQTYLDRARKVGRGLGFRGFEVQEIAESRVARAADRIAREGESLLALQAKAGRSVCLDAGGELLDSDEFTAVLTREQERAAPRLTYVIGGPDGLSQDVIRSAERILSFGRVTWPHQLVRVLLAEQLYRAMTILSGHPYHRI